MTLGSAAEPAGRWQRSSLWAASLRDLANPAAAPPPRAEVVVVGGGLTGLLIAGSRYERDGTVVAGPATAPAEVTPPPDDLGTGS